MTTLNTVPVIASGRFHYNPATRTFSAEISDIGDEFNGVPDAIDVKSDRTGAVKRFAYERTNRDPRENEILEWRYRCAGENMTLVLFND